MYGNNDYRDYLAHYGVLGMKWGRRKAKVTSGKSTKNDHRVSTTVKNAVKRKIKDSTKTIPTNPIDRKKEYDKVFGNPYPVGSLKYHKRKVELENKRRNPGSMTSYEWRLYNSQKGNI